VIERVLAWAGTDRFEYCHVWEQPGRLSARGTILTGTYRADYELDTGPGYEPKRLRARVTAAGVTRLVRLRRDIDGEWWVRDGLDPRPFTDVAGIDLDLSPFLIALPLQRLPLHHRLGRRTVAVAAVSLPSLTVRRQVQTLTHLRPGAVRVTVGALSTDLRLDADGYVTEYPGVATRVRPGGETARAVG
jgi:uncharacterized protein